MTPAAYNLLPLFDGLSWKTLEKRPKFPHMTEGDLNHECDVRIVKSSYTNNYISTTMWCTYTESRHLFHLMIVFNDVFFQETKIGSIEFALSLEFSQPSSCLDEAM